MRYLVIETVCGEHHFMHFIALNKEEVFDDVNSYSKHIASWKGETVIKVYFSQTALSNW